MFPRAKEIFCVDRDRYQQGAKFGDRHGDPCSCDAEKSRQKEMMAEVFPLDSAVKNPEDVMFNPLNRKLTAKSLKPATART